jgi:hypothetical protein
LGEGRGKAKRGGMWKEGILGWKRRQTSQVTCLIHDIRIYQI